MTRYSDSRSSAHTRHHIACATTQASGHTYRSATTVCCSCCCESAPSCPVWSTSLCLALSRLAHAPSSDGRRPLCFFCAVSADEPRLASQARLATVSFALGPQAFISEPFEDTMEATRVLYIQPDAFHTRYDALAHGQPGQRPRRVRFRGFHLWWALYSHLWPWSVSIRLSGPVHTPNIRVPPVLRIAAN